MWQRSCIVGLLLVGLIGCTGKLETGYKPRLIGDNDVQRRGYYAGQFTTQGKAAEMAGQTDPELRNPTAGPKY